MNPSDLARAVALLEAEAHLGRDLTGTVAVCGDSWDAWLLVGDEHGSDVTLWPGEGVLVVEDDPSGRVLWCEWWEQGRQLKRIPVEVNRVS